MATLHLPHTFPRAQLQTLPRIFRRPQMLLISLIAVLVFLIAYVALLNHEDRTMEAYYADLRASDSELYLSKIMQARGFRTFLAEYEDIHDYTQPIAEVPSFLVGRWALFDKAKRVSDDFVPDACVNGVEIEDGQFKVFGDKSAPFSARYTMMGNTVTAHLNGAATARIDVIGYGSHLHHIEVTLPGGNAVRYGYMCR